MQQDEKLAENNEEIEIELESESSEKKEESEDKVEVVEENESEQEESSEQEEYSEGVQKRINKLTYKLREAERQNQEAVSWAQKVQEENKQLKQKAESANSAMFTEYDSRVNTELVAAKAEYKEAFDKGDTDKMIEANEKLSRLAVEAESLKRVNAKREKEKESTVESEASKTEATDPTPPKPDPKAQEWASKNPWFGEDQGATFAAFGIHRELMEEGYDGRTDEYYTELDKRLSKFAIKGYTDNQEEVPDSPVQRVASPTRQARTKKARNKTVKLTQSQVAIAKKLGVPLEEYAKYVKE